MSALTWEDIEDKSAEELWEGLSPMGRAAVTYTRANLAVIPLIVRDKVPLTEHGRDNWCLNPDDVAQYWTLNPTANVGIVTGEVSRGLVVIDIDVHEGRTNGLESIAEWEVATGMKLPETVTFRTGSGGRHLLYRAKGKPRNSTNDSLGIDVRGEGGYIVAPPSIHPNGDSYTEIVSLDDMDIAQANDAVYAFLDYVRSPERPAGEHPQYSRFELPEVIGEGGRNDTLYRYACSMRTSGFDYGPIRDELGKANQRCNPPMSGRDLDKIAESACQKPKGYSAEVLDFKARQTQVAPTSNEGEGEEPTKQSITKKTLAIMDASEDLTLGLRYNEDEMLPYVTDNVIAGAPFFGPHPLTDEEEALLLLMVESRGGTGDVGKFRTATKAYLGMERHRYSPLKEAFSKLPLVRSASGAPVGSAIDIEYSEDNGHTWKMAPPESIRGLLFPSFLGVTISDYSREAEILISRGIVARAMHPGCKYDYMPILLGEQGTGKSTVIRKLALEDEFSIEGFNRFDEEGVKRLEGKLIAEVGELSGFNGADMNAIKDFVTRTKDTYRRSYGRYAITVPRRCILIGTSNNRYVLDDATGNRRFLIIECGREREDPAPGIFDGTFDLCVRIWLAVSLKEREELGEAEFHKLLRLPPSVLAEAQVTQESHSFEDSTVNAVNDYLDSLPMDVKRVNVKMVMMDGMGYGQKEYVEAKKWLKSAVATAIEKRGWVPEQGKQRVYNERGRCFGTAKSWGRPAS